MNQFCTARSPSAAQCSTSTEYLSSEGIVICKYFDVRHAKAALERLQNRAFGRNKITVEWEVPKDVLFRLFPPHSYPTLGRITIPDLSTKIRIDDVKCVMQQFGEIWSLHMGPMNFRNSSWTAILEYCDIRDAGRAYVAISQHQVLIQNEAITASAEIRRMVGPDRNDGPDTESSTAHAHSSLRGIREPRYAISRQSPPCNASSVTNALFLSTSPCPSDAKAQQNRATTPPLTASSAQMFLEAYLTNQQPKSCCKAVSHERHVEADERE